MNDDERVSRKRSLKSPEENSLNVKLMSLAIGLGNEGQVFGLGLGLGFWKLSLLTSLNNVHKCRQWLALESPLFCCLPGSAIAHIKNFSLAI